MRPTKGYVCEEGHSWVELCRQDGNNCGHPLCVCAVDTPIVRFMTADEINEKKLVDLQWAAAVALAEFRNK